jgi:hypothetical protein
MMPYQRTEMERGARRLSVWFHGGKKLKQQARRKGHDLYGCFTILAVYYLGKQELDILNKCLVFAYYVEQPLTV